MSKSVDASDNQQSMSGVETGARFVKTSFLCQQVNFQNRKSFGRPQPYRVSTDMQISAHISMHCVVWKTPQVWLTINSTSLSLQAMQSATPPELARRHNNQSIGIMTSLRAGSLNLRHSMISSRRDHTSRVALLQHSVSLDKKALMKAWQAT